MHGERWILFALLLVPDLSMLGYVAGGWVGAAFGLLWGSPVVVALIWFAHKEMDRMLGYGLKYQTGFEDTHLGRL